jgi:hypothetical protein
MTTPKTFLAQCPPTLVDDVRAGRADQLRSPD